MRIGRIQHENIYIRKSENCCSHENDLYEKTSLIGVFWGEKPRHFE